ncbi:hypothetical protein [Neobacillus sp. LXY-4]|uniref:hypothetical protein n=1 Tax=Neobacillus sp. LXY-4 TaxID=3379826 RepID=UPI003EDF5DF3
MKELIRKGFTIFLMLFMFGGTLLVVGQLLGMIIQNGELMIQTSEYIGKPTFICAAIAGTLGFIYSYFPKEAK